MNIVIVGWYGTETLGDRAILDGIFRMYSSKYSKIYFYIGSIWPFFSARTLYEERILWKDYSVFIFDLKDKKKTKSLIEKCDYLIFGGGPIMDNIGYLEHIALCFKFAKKKNKTTLIVGCGIGPLKERCSLEYATILFEYADKILLRDKNSCALYKKYWGDGAKFIDDPAMLSAVEYRSNHENEPENQSVVIALRDNPVKMNESKKKFDEIMRELINLLKKDFNSIILWPMHTFCIGGDDRKYLYSISKEYGDKKVHLENNPGSICRMYDTFINAQACIGMRYHSVVFQTLLNGNNYILDYTNGRKGKIYSFLQSYNLQSLYKERYVDVNNLEYECLIDLVETLKEGKKYKCELDLSNNWENEI